jgi:SAM-dependent methyltransferase
VSYGRADDAEAQRLQQQVARLWHREEGLLRELGWRREARLLDVGCGPGATMQKLANAFAVGLDRDLDHLRRGAGLRVRGDAAALPFAGGSFEIVLLRLVLRHVPDPQKAVLEAARVASERVCVLDSDDLACVLHPEPPSWPRLSAALAESVRRRRGDPAMGRRLRQLLHEADLCDLQARVQPISTDEMPAPMLVEMLLAPAARPLDADLMPPDEAAQAWAEVRAWARRPDAFGWILGVGASGKKR